MWRIGITITPSKVTEGKFHAVFIVGRLISSHPDSPDKIDQDKSEEMYHVSLSRIFEKGLELVRKLNYDAEISVYFLNTYSQELGSWRLRREELVKFMSNDSVIFAPIAEKIKETRPLWNIPIIGVS